MPKVSVPRTNVTPGEVVTVLSRRPGPGYQVESDGGRRVTVRKSALMYANISVEGIVDYVGMRHDSARAQLKVLRRIIPRAVDGFPLAAERLPRAA